MSRKIKYGIQVFILILMAVASIYLDRVWGIVVFNNYYTDRVMRRYIIYAIVIFAVYDLYDIRKAWCREHKNEIFFFVLTIVMISIPLFIPNLRQGEDLQFHLNRIEGIYHGLRSGVFPVKIQPHWFDGMGYASGVMYGDLLFYIPAFLRFMGFDLDTSYKAFLLLINVLTVWIAVYSYKKIFHDPKTGSICAFVYSTSAYRLLNAYRRCAIGELIAMIFLPLISLAIYKIYVTKCEDREENKKIIVWLTVGMSMLVQNHILSTEMTAICIFFVCLFFWKTTFKKNVLLVYAKSCLWTMLLSLYFIVPFLDYYFNEDMRINNFVESESYRNILPNALSIGRYFEFFYIHFPEVDPEYNFNPGIVLMGTFVAAIFLYMHKKLSKKEKIFFGFSIIWLVIASKLFPWNLVGNYTRFGALMAGVQFPWRYVAYASVFLTLLFGEIYNNRETLFGMNKKQFSIMTVMISFLMVSFFSTAYDEYDVICEYKETEDIDDYCAGNKEYMLTGADLDKIQTDILTDKEIEVYSWTKSGYKVQISCLAGKEGGTVEVPVFFYRGFRAVDADGNILETDYGRNKCVKIIIPGNYEGIVRLDFYEPWYWRAAEMISAMFAGIILLKFWRHQRAWI